MTRLSSSRTRRKPFSIACFSTSRSCTGSRESIPLAMVPSACARIVSGVARGIRGCGVGMSSSKLNMAHVSSLHLLRLWRSNDRSMHRAQFFVQIIRGEIRAVMPGDRRKSVVEIEVGEANSIAQDVEVLAVEIVGEIDHALFAVVEFQPDLVVSEIPRLCYVSLYVLVSGQLDLRRAGG